MNSKQTNTITEHENVIDQQHPYLGLSAFDEEHKDYFFGRDREILGLKRMVVRSVLTVFFGKSGLGKSSLLRAGLFPALRQDYYLPIYIRINFLQSEVTPLEQVKQWLEKEMLKHDHKATPIGDQTLWEYFHSTMILGGLVTPVLVFDQFEEIFTLGRSDQVKALFSELADLIENQVPVSVQKKYKDTPILVDSQKSNYKVIFSLREDYLPQLESVNTLIPSIKHSRFRLKQLTSDHAFEAVYEPASGIIDKEQAQKIVDLLIKSVHDTLDDDGENAEKHYEIEPFLLSLICERINARRFDQDGGMISAKITDEILENVKIKDIVENFYNESTAHCSENLNAFIEKKLLTSDGYRRLQPMADAIGVYQVPKDEIQELINKRILRKEIWHGREQIELIHDILVPVIRKRRDQREQRERALEVEKILKERDQKRKIKNRKINIAVAIGLISASWFITYMIKEKQNRDKAAYFSMAQQLAYTSKSLGVFDAIPKALLARQAYSFNQRSGMQMNDELYQALYSSLYFLDAFDEDYNTLRDGNNNQGRLQDMLFRDSILYSVTKDGLILKWNFNESSKVDTINHNKVYEIDYKEGKAYYAYYAIDVDPKNHSLIAAVQRRFQDLENQNQQIVPDQVIELPETNDVLVDTDKNIAYTAGNRGIIRIWNLDSLENGFLKPIDSINTLEGKIINTIAINESYLAIGTRERGAYLIDRTTHNSIALDIDKTTQTISAISFDPENTWLVLGSTKGRITFYNLEKNDYTVAHYNSGQVTDIEFHKGKRGVLMAAANSDKRIALWSMESLEIRPLMIADENIIEAPYDLEFDSSGENLYAGYANGQIIKFPLVYDRMISSICTYLCKNEGESYYDDLFRTKLTDVEWNLYIGVVYARNETPSCVCEN